MGVTSCCSQLELPAWHAGSAMLQNGASNDSCCSRGEVANHSSEGQRETLPASAPEVASLPADDTAPPGTASITCALVSPLLLRAGLLPALQLCARLCSTMEGDILQVNFWLAVFAACHPHTTSCQRISRASSGQRIQCSPPPGVNAIYAQSQW